MPSEYRLARTRVWYYPWTVFVSIGVLFWSTVIVCIVTGA
jgi:hypothetical protein